MIIEGIFNVIFLLFDFLVSPFSTWRLNFDSTIWHSSLKLLTDASWFLPVNDLIPILFIMIGIKAWGMFVSFIRTLWDALPLT